MQKPVLRIHLEGISGDKARQGFDGVVLEELVMSALLSRLLSQPEDKQAELRGGLQRGGVGGCEDPGSAPVQSGRDTCCVPVARSPSPSPHGPAPPDPTSVVASRIPAWLWWLPTPFLGIPGA